ncbi:MAG TPA: HAMP domain-containing sensor histidine kinase [Solirubrobacteraceae bacterium]|nr:HAMP domain-containing sensor histidine kinase [Solirubrobacteraceae bacterium]
MIFGVAVRTITAHRLRANFDSQVVNDATSLAGDLHPTFGNVINIPPQAQDLFGVGGAVVRFYELDGSVPPGGIDDGTPYLGNMLPDPPAHGYRTSEHDGYEVVTENAEFSDGGLLIQYGMPLASLRSEIAQIDWLVFLGILTGTALAFGAGWFVARRAITPIAELTAAASEIERTGDPTLKLPEPTADDEVAELTRTLTTMLAALADARGRTESALEQQRAFVADASHELRTPLTSVLANLELLEESLSGPDRDLARSALRSTQRMRRLVADLLLLARTWVPGGVWRIAFSIRLIATRWRSSGAPSSGAGWASSSIS